MTRFVLVLFSAFVLAGGLLSVSAKGGDEAQRKSFNASYPQPFTANGNNPVNQPAISTGYYVVDSEDRAGGKWTPNSALLFQDTTFEPATWRRIVSGPNQFPAEYWATNPDGKAYFRNPNNINDSTDNAFAGPIKIGFPFYFNGIRYDSFYVSTNGLVALSNRRYFYDAEGNRTIPDGQTTAYDPNSDDERARNDVDGLNDATLDNYGYQYVALGNTTSPTGGIRNANNSTGLAGFVGDGSRNAPIIAPFWDDMQLSQFNSQINQPEDYGRVYFKRSINNSQLRIFFVRLQPIGAKGTPNGTITFGPNHRLGFGTSMEINAQVILDRRDSTVTYLYKTFQPPLLIVNNRPLPPARVVRDNATIGVRGRARYIDQNSGNEVRYMQYTEYLRDGNVFVVGPAGSAFTTPANDLSIKFKQYKNVVRVVGIKYLIRDPSTGNFTKEVSDPTNYELLVGDVNLGAIQPVAVFQNLTNSIQGPTGVNFQQQQLSFRTRFRIQNDIIGVISDTIVYNRQVCVDSFALANSNASGVRLVNWDGNTVNASGLNGVPPYGFVEVKFPPYETNQFLTNQIGRLTSYVIAEPFECRGRNGYGDEWPFDDTTSVRLFGIKILSNFEDNVGDFSFSRREGTLPSVNKWVSIGAEAVDGDANCYNPPPPRGVKESANNRFITLNSPVIRMNRIDLNGNDLSRGGDKLISFPVDIRNREGAVLSLSYQRTGRPPSDDFPRGWSDDQLIGPEPRVIFRGDPTSVRATEDRLEVHFANPSPNNYDNITNIADNGYSKHPRLDDPGKFISNNPAYTIFGAGGLRRGFSEFNPDSALTDVQGLRATIFDDGKDWEFNKVFIPIPDYIINAPEEGARYFRFKIEVDAARNSNPPQPQDDDDNFYVDNIRILFPTETPDLEVSVVRAKWPYTMTPASQAQEIPVIVKISNNSNISSRSFAAGVFIKEEGASDDLRVYCRAKTIPFLPGNQEVEVNFPNWNGRKTRPGNYILSTRLFGNSDPNPDNDSTYGEFELVFGDAFAYDPPTPTGSNNVPTFAGKNGKGLNLEGYASGSGTNPAPFGADAGNSSGQIAMKFVINSQDTVLGYRAHFGGLNQDLNNISFSIYRDAGGSPGQRIANTTVLKKRGLDEISGDALYDTYTTYLLNRPIVLSEGTYWMSVAQLGTEGFELGAAESRMGMVTTNYSDIPVLGVSGTSLNIDKNFRERNIAGELINSNVFAFENTRFSGTWTQFTPTVGNPGYGHLDHAGYVNLYNSYSRGSWIPLIRPYFGERTYADPPRYEDDKFCESFYPVELVDFNGEVLPPAGIELYWETASENNNAGFYVERRFAGTNADFASIGFVKGAGSSTQPLDYKLLDQEVVRGQAYEYRLRQVDFDGSVSYSKSITLTYEYADELTLTNSPNPISESTEIKFSVPERSFVTLQVVDVFGNVVNTLVNEELSASDVVPVKWNGRDFTGNQVAAGTYIVRLTVGEQTAVHKVNVVR